MPRLVTDHAKRIASKLEAEVEARSKHDIAKIFVDGVLVASFGIRRGSSKDLPHDYIPGQIFVSSADALRLAQCPMSRTEWIEKAREKGKLNS